MLDVLENHFGETPTARVIKSMNAAEIDELGDAVLASANVTVGDIAPEGAVYLGGFFGNQWHNAYIAEHLHLALLYYPRLLVHDPLAEYFFADFERVPKMRPMRAADSGISSSGGPAIWGRNNTWAQHRDDLEYGRDCLASTVESLTVLAPLIRSGVLVLRSQWPTIIERQDKLMVSVASDVKSDQMQQMVEEAREVGDYLPTWDYLWGLQVWAGSAIDRRDLPWRNQNEFFYLAKTLAVADQAGAIYVPPAERDLALLRAKAEQVTRKLRNMPPIELLHEVARVLVPDMALTAETALAIRTSDEDFADWRRRLRSLARDSSNDSLDEMRERVEDELLPIRNRIVRATSRSAALKSTLTEQSAAAILSGAVGLAAAAATGDNLIVPAASSLGTGVLLWLWNAYRPPRLGGTDAVVASLIRSATIASQPEEARTV